MISVPLTLGDFVFDETELEVPETMGDLAGTQTVAQHDFPGGVRTHQAFGYFPAAIRWQARFSGGDASDRAEQVKRILYAGQEVVLSWGERAWQGRLVKFCPKARHTWLFEYDLEFWPRLDISAGQGESDGAPDPDMIMGLQTLALASALAATDGTFFPLIAPTVAAPVQALLAVIATETLIAGTIAAFTNAQQLAVQAATAAVLAATAPLQALADATLASPAWDIASRALVISSLVAAGATPRWVIPVINPDLTAIAAQYYGTAALWNTIAAANGLDDPMPIGTFQLMIPPPPA